MRSRLVSRGSATVASRQSGLKYRFAGRAKRRIKRLKNGSPPPFEVELDKLRRRRPLLRATFSSFVKTFAPTQNEYSIWSSGQSELPAALLP